MERGPEGGGVRGGARVGWSVVKGMVNSHSDHTKQTRPWPIHMQHAHPCCSPATRHTFLAPPLDPLPSAFLPRADALELAQQAESQAGSSTRSRDT
jgi:hypothetical protein